MSDVANKLPTTSEFVARFKRKYPGTIGWRYLKNSEVVEKHLNPGEQVVYAFIAQKNDKLFQIFESAVVALTTQRIIIGRKRVLFGYFIDSITPDMFNDLKVTSGIFFGKVKIDTIKELVVLTDISKKALPELYSKISNYMTYMKNKNSNDSENRKETLQ